MMHTVRPVTRAMQANCTRKDEDDAHSTPSGESRAGKTAHGNSENDAHREPSGKSINNNINNNIIDHIAMHKEKLKMETR